MISGGTWQTPQPGDQGPISKSSHVKSTAPRCHVMRALCPVIVPPPRTHEARLSMRKCPTGLQSPCPELLRAVKVT